MLSNYDIHEIVAQSPESVVFAGEERAGGAPMAMRRYLVRRDGERSGSDAAAFLEEVERYRGLEDPQVVGILEAGFDAQDHNPFFVTRTGDGESLTKMLKGALLADSDARAVVEGALDGLEILHGRGLVHGGVRPERLVWSRTSGVCLVDAGVEAALVKLGDYVAVGEAATTAPELRGRRSVAGDFFGLGASVFELLTGAPLDAGARPAVGDGDLARWNPWIEKMCAADPAARPATVAEARALLANALEAPAAATPANSAPARATAAPMLVRAAPAAPVTLTVANPAAAASGWKPGTPINITGQSPVAPLPAKRRVVTPVRVAAGMLCLGVVGGAVFLANRPPAAVADTSAPVTSAAAASSPVAPAPNPTVPPPKPRPSTGPSVPRAEQAKAPEYFVKDAKDIEKLKARPDGEPANLHGQVRSVALSRSGDFIDLIFRGTGARAFIKIDTTVANQPTLAELQRTFTGKKVKIFGTVEHRKPEEGAPPIGVRFLKAEDITIE